MTTAGNQYCFFPNGDIVGFDSPCFPDQEISPCCGLVNGWTCLTNGICYHPKTKVLGRGTCTDPKWGSPNCPQFCTENEYKGEGGLEYDNHGPTLWQCSNQWAAEGGLMCCDISANPESQHNGSCCSGINAINLFTIGSRIGNATSITLLSSTTTTPPLSSTRVSSDSLVSATSFASSTDLSDPQFSKLSAALLSSSLSSSTTSASTTNPSTSNKNNSGTNGRTVAIAVSISVVAIVLIIAGFLVYQRRRRGRRKLDEKNQSIGEIDVNVGSANVLASQEMDGQQAQELPTGPGGLRSEMSG